MTDKNDINTSGTMCDITDVTSNKETRSRAMWALDSMRKKASEYGFMSDGEIDDMLNEIRNDAL